MSGRADAFRGEDKVHARAASEVEHAFALFQQRGSHRVSAAEARRARLSHILFAVIAGGHVAYAGDAV